MDPTRKGEYGHQAFQGRKCSETDTHVEKGRLGNILACHLELVGFGRHLTDMRI